MTNPSFNPDDPRLTAFVLGELDDADRVAVEQLLESSPEARAFVDDLQDTIGVLRDELSTEPAASLTDEQRAALTLAADSAPEADSPAMPVRGSAEARPRSPQGLLAGVIATVAALGIVIAVLPQISNQRLSDSSGIASTLSPELADEESSIAMRGSGLDRADESERSEMLAANHQAAPFDGLKIEAVVAAPAEYSGATPMAKDAPADEAAALPAKPQYNAAGDLVAKAGKALLPTESESDNSAVSAGSLSQVVSGETSGPAGTPRTGKPATLPTGPVSGDAKELPNSVATTAPAKAPQPVSITESITGPRAAPTGEAAPTRESVSNRGRRVMFAPPAVNNEVRVARTAGARPIEVGEKFGESQRGGTIRSTAPTSQPGLRDGRGFVSGGLGGGSGRQPSNETYEPIVENEFVVPDPRDPNKRMSTISVDVDTASYSNMRRFLMQNQLPPPNAVRIEELVNYFKYDYPQPQGDDPFSVTTEVMLCPWQPGHRLARIGLQAKTIDKSQRPPTNLVFLLDVSGSMRPANKLPLVQQAMRLLVEEMTEDDQIAIVTYASNAGLRLVSTPGSKKPEILQAIDMLTAGGSTNGEGGIKLAYDTAIRHYIQEGANRVILCTDGDFNVGVSNDNELVELIQEKAASGVFLSVFGFGMGNLKDGKLEKLADKGNGQYGYIDSLQEARRAFKEGLAGTLYTVAKDVKLQAEFNPTTVGAYRLIGYENRKLAAADFTDDTKDAGEIGAGHTVTALYEIVPRQVLIDRLNSNEFRYGSTFELPTDAPKIDGFSNELFFVRLRYKQPDQETSQPVEADFPVIDVAITGKPLATPSVDLQFASAVASFGMNLRNSQYRGNWDMRRVYDVAVQTRGEDTDGRRTEFIDLVQRTLRIIGQPIVAEPTASSPVTRPVELPAAEARIKATADGKYRRLLQKIEVRDDVQQYGAFNDFGFWDQSTEYKGHSDLLPGYWVYVYPHWYIWGDAAATRVPPAETKTDQPGASDSPAEPASAPSETPANPQE